jgi:Flp pilus assembly protein TadD
LVSRAGRIVPKNDLVQAGWQDVAVTDSSLLKVIAQLRALLDPANPDTYIQTLARRGYRFVAPVTRDDVPMSDAEMQALIEPYRAFVDGRAQIEFLERKAVVESRRKFEAAAATREIDTAAHILLANTCVLEFEATRKQLFPDVDALRVALVHAEKACRQDRNSGEAWSTLGFVLERLNDPTGALVALRQGVDLDPDNWRVHLRLAAGTWGEQRLLAVRRTLDLGGEQAIPHWLAATVYVARQRLPIAEEHVDAGLAAMPDQPAMRERFPGIALDWLKGLLCLARGAGDDAMAAFKRELAREAGDHLYARECCANTWYAIGVCHLLRDETADARTAFKEAMTRVPSHPMVHAGLAWLDGRTDADALKPAASSPVDLAMAHATLLVSDRQTGAAVTLVNDALTSAPPGNAGWLLPIEPLLRVYEARTPWAAALRTLRMRAL